MPTVIPRAGPPCQVSADGSEAARVMFPVGENAVSLAAGSASIGTLGASEAHVGEVGSSADVISVTPAIDTNAYTSGDAVGGKQTLTSAARVSGGKVLLNSVVVVDKGNQKKPLTILFFDSDPSAATITNNAAFAFSTDITKVVGRVNVVAGDYETVDSKAVACVKAIGLEMKASGSANLYAAVVTTDTPTYTSASDLIFRYGFAQA